MGSFNNIKLPLSIKTTKDDPNQKLFIPLLSESVKYDVAVGYFSSLWVRDVAEGIAKLALNGGKCRWILSPNFNEDDYKSILNGESVNKDKGIYRLIQQSFDTLFDALINETRKTLSWLIQDSVLEIKIGVPCNDLDGIMHAKMGVFVDSNNKKVGFSGSYNLTGAAKSNWERIDVFDERRGGDSIERIADIENDFELMWSGQDENLTIYTPSSKNLLKYIEFTKCTARPYKILINRKISTPTCYLDKNGKLREYQEDAVNKWLKNNGRGVFCMATGSGKTVTALYAISKVANFAIDRKSSLFICIVVPYIHLAEQWMDEAQKFGFDVIGCFDGVKKWEESFISLKHLLTLKSGTVGVVICTNSTFISKNFQKYSDIFSQTTTVFVADEMHNLGAPIYSKSLPQTSQYRIGLSATPERHNDEEGTLKLFEYFGKEIVSFTLEDAIKSNCLTKYFYYPQLVEMTTEEWELYCALTKKIARYLNFNSDGGVSLAEGAKGLLLKRARLINSMENKYNIFIKLVKEKGVKSHTLVYTGDVKEGERKAVEHVVHLLGKKLGINCNKFTSETSPEDRKKLLKDFDSGHTAALVAIKCLDEGVDIPSTQTAYILASSTNPREYIQRRGRVLRKSDGKDYAYIYDFIAIPPEKGFNFETEYEKKCFSALFKRELARIEEFASLAVNYGDSIELFLSIKKELNLLHT